jgi:hypothetical protein
MLHCNNPALTKLDTKSQEKICAAHNKLKIAPHRQIDIRVNQKINLAQYPSSTGEDNSLTYWVFCKISKKSLDTPNGFKISIS